MELISRLASRDVTDEFSAKQLDAMELEEFVSVVQAKETAWADEIETHGLERLVIAETPDDSTIH